MPGTTIPDVMPPFDAIAIDSKIACDASYPLAIPASAPMMYVTPYRMRTVVASRTSPGVTGWRPMCWYVVTTRALSGASASFNVATIDFANMPKR